MNTRKIYIYRNDTELTRNTLNRLISCFENKGFTVSEELTSDCELIICLGGDGTLLRLLPTLNYPENVPIVGVNTGHMGFFQEFEIDKLEELAQMCADKTYSIQNHKLLRARVFKDGKLLGDHKSINDVTIRCTFTRLSHLDVSIGSTFIEHFSGDGVIVSTPVGSTAYNYSVGGAIVDPRISNVLQVSPIAPVNNATFRSFTSGLILPSDLEVIVSPDPAFGKKVILCFDGFEFDYEDADSVHIALDGENIQIARSSDFSFWGKVASKLL